MLRIELNKMQFHGYHGVHEEESKAGGNFEVNLIVYFEPVAVPVRYLTETIDYTQLYTLVKQRMEKPTRLLETIATEMANEIFKIFSSVQELEVSIKKLNPPIPFFNGSVAAVYTAKRGDLKQNP